VSGAPITSQRFEENRHKFRDYVFTRTAHNYKFWIVSLKTAICGAGLCVVQTTVYMHVWGMKWLCLCTQLSPQYASILFCVLLVLDWTPVCSHHTAIV